MSGRIQRKNMKQIRDERISRDVLRCGSDILYSEQFKKAAYETHHLQSSVYDHSITVCITSVQICLFLQKLGFRINEKDLIHASLCHDLGMIGRRKKFRKRTDAWQRHANDSASIAHKLIPDLSENADSMIKTHMWPVSSSHPRSREAFILNAAEKYSSIADWVFFLTGKRSGEKIRKELEKEQP